MTTTAKDLLTLARLPDELICRFLIGELTPEKIAAYDRLLEKVLKGNGFIIPLTYGLHERICKALKYFILRSWKLSTENKTGTLKVIVVSFNEFLYGDEFLYFSEFDIVYIHNFYDVIEDRKSRQQPRHKNICLKIKACPNTKFILGMVMEDGHPLYALRDAFSNYWADFLTTRFTMMSQKPVT